MIFAMTTASPIGEILIATTENGICLVEFSHAEIFDNLLSQLEKQHKTHVQFTSHPLLITLIQQLAEYFDHQRTDFSLPLDPVGTPFQHSVWQTLIDIPYGTTISYAEQANKIGNPKAIRAVASSNGKNPISILVPCHRVIGSNGQLIGYAGGLWRKSWLLQHEQVKTLDQ